MGGERGTDAMSGAGIVARVRRWLLGGAGAPAVAPPAPGSPPAEPPAAVHAEPPAAVHAEAAAREDADALLTLAQTAFRQGRAEEALDLLARADAQRPHDPAIVMLRGRVTLYLGDQTAAAACFEAVHAATGSQEAARRIAGIGAERANVDRPDRPTVLVTYGTPQFAEAQARLADSAVAAGRIDRTIAWTAAQLRETPFYAAHRNVLDAKRGAGFWAWKPFLILAAFDAVPEGGYVVYYDSGRGGGYRFRQSVAPIIRWCEAAGTGALPGVYLPWARNAVWTRRDCFVRMGCDAQHFWDAPQIQATFSVWRHDARNRAFVARWLEFCTDRAIVSDDPNIEGLPNFPEFHDHRHDQSILTNLCVAEGRPAFGAPTEMTEIGKDINAIIGRILAAGF